MDTSSQILRPQKKIHIIIGETMQLSEINGKQMSQGMDSRFQEAIRHLKSMTAEKSRLVNRQKTKKTFGNTSSGQRRRHWDSAVIEGRALTCYNI